MFNKMEIVYDIIVDGCCGRCCCCLFSIRISADIYGDGAYLLSKIRSLDACLLILRISKL